ncbi:MAG TPA: hypothetical protein VI874_01360 [Candidatus Norongarragalinales archaeon]|nr:hypothetical protein [Candidatus Norongarragalinales archaeon]
MHLFDFYEEQIGRTHVQIGPEEYGPKVKPWELAILRKLRVRKNEES